MNIESKPKFPLTPEATRQQTGKTPDEWFALVDTRLGRNPGRKAVGDFLFKEMKVDAWWAATLVVGYEAARGIVEKDGRPRGYAICVTKSIAAAAEQVFALVADAKWTGADTKIAIQKATPGKLIRFALNGGGHPEGELVEIKLTPSAGKVSIVLNHERIQDRGRADGLRDAWGAVLNEWKTSLEAK
ncbi:MAG: hypothetical protein KJ070_22975 [Verrucomicrobia bacterium]|nr:hypothetical protein [Verrucomicrobiota bacterium]